MSILDALTAPVDADNTLAGIAESRRELSEADLAAAELTISQLRESMADLELALEDRNWQRLDAWGEWQFTREGIERAARICRVMSVANPLIRRGLAIRTTYVWAGGLTIQAKAKGGDSGQQDVNAVVQDFLDDQAVVDRLTGGEARETNERTLGTDGNLFAALFTHPRTGRVQPRLIPLEEIVEVIKNPEDRSEPWFYRRTSTGPDGNLRTTYHPDVDYQPAVRVTTFQAGARIGMIEMMPGEVLWDAPIVHQKVNALAHWDYGIGDAYTAVSWARAYKEFLEDWAKLVKALSRFAWKLTSSRKSGAQNAASAIRSTQQQADDRVLPRYPESNAGATFAAVGANLEAIPKTGATIDSESGKPLAAMVASAMDVPVTLLLSDPGVTGARATATTLETPTELMARMRQNVDEGFLRRILNHVIDAAVRAPQGALKGTLTRDEWDRTVITLDGDTTRTIEFAWPDLSETPIDVLLRAIQAADGIGKLPPLVIVRLILSAFQVPDADEIIGGLTDDEGNFIDPAAAADAAAQQAAAAALEAFRRGEDPAGMI